VQGARGYKRYEEEDTCYEEEDTCYEEEDTCYEEEDTCYEEEDTCYEEEDTCTTALTFERLQMLKSERRSIFINYVYMYPPPHDMYPPPHMTCTLLCVRRGRLTGWCQRTH
jgi:hypothetical protein